MFDWTYTWKIFRRYNSCWIIVISAMINRWLICWIVGAWVKIIFFFWSLNIWITCFDFSNVIAVFSFLISSTKQKLNNLIFWEISVLETMSKQFLFSKFSNFFLWCNICVDSLRCQCPWPRALDNLGAYGRFLFGEYCFIKSAS